MGRARALLTYSATQLGLDSDALADRQPGVPAAATGPWRSGGCGAGQSGSRSSEGGDARPAGLDQSLLQQYLDYLNGLLHGDLGQALINQEPVSTIIGRTLPANLELSSIALLVAAIVGLSIGFSGIARPEGKLDLAGRLYGLGTYALLLLGGHAGAAPVRRESGLAAGGRTLPPSLLPPEGTGFYLLDSIRQADWLALRGTVRHLTLPAGTLALLIGGTFTTAPSPEPAPHAGSDYIQIGPQPGTDGIPRRAAPWPAQCPAAGAHHRRHHRGISDRRCPADPEVTFSWPGIALRLQEAINQRDYPVVQGIVVVIAALVVLVSVAVDLLVATLDPRIRY